jgi:hypothetical protein
MCTIILARPSRFGSAAITEALDKVYADYQPVKELRAQ